MTTDEASKEDALLIERIMLGSVSLSSLPLKERKPVVKRLIARAESDPKAVEKVEELLKGRIQDARPIGRGIAASKNRHVLLRAWIGWLQSARTSYLEEQAPLDVKEVAARGQWIAKQLGKMRAVPEDLAAQLLDEVVALGVLVLQLPTGQTAERALLPVIAELRKWVKPIDERILSLVATSVGPYRHRASLVRDLDAESIADAPLMPRMRDLALREDPEFADYLFSAIPDHVERSRELSRAIRSGCNAKVAQQVIEALLETSSPEHRAVYLDPIVALALEAQGLPPSLADSLVHIVSTVPRERAAVGPVAPVLYDIDAILKSKYDAELERHRQEHEAAIQAAEARILALIEEVGNLRELVESVKGRAREPERQTEHRVRVETLKPVCLIHQDIVRALRDRPDVHLVAFARTLQGALERQGISPLASQGETVTFDPSQHEHAHWSSQKSGAVRIVAPGYELTHPLLNVRDVLVRAVVEQATTE